MGGILYDAATDMHVLLNMLCTPWQTSLIGVQKPFPPLDESDAASTMSACVLTNREEMFLKNVN